jgi:hypothetical protein
MTRASRDGSRLFVPPATARRADAESELIVEAYLAKAARDVPVPDVLRDVLYLGVPPQGISDLC